MTRLCVCAIAGEGLANLGVGLEGGSLRTVESGDLVAVVDDVSAPPRVDPETLTRYDALLRRLWNAASALLPVRFATLARSEDELREMLARRADGLSKALALVRGRGQMTVRVFAGGAPRPSADPPVRESGPGTRFLAARVRAHAVPELEPLRGAVRSFVRGERVERHDDPALRASVYHLIETTEAPAYLAALEGALPSHAKVRASGPHPPYAFAQGELS